MNNRKSFTNAVMKTSQYATDMNNEDSIYEIKTWIDSGNIMTNVLLSGHFDKGYPSGKIITISGEEHTGKSIVIMKGLVNFLAKHEDNVVILYESEGSVIKDVIPKEFRERFIVIPVQTVEEFSKLIVQHIESYKKDFKEEIKNGETRVLFALDSLGNLGFEKEMNDALAGKSAQDMGLKAKKLKQLGRNICMNLTKIRTALIIANHVYADPNAGMYASRKDRYKQSGGSAVRYLSSVIINLTKGYEKEKEGKVKRASKVKVKAILDKSRLIREDSFVRFTIDFDKGINKFSGLFEFFEEYGMFEKVNQMTYKFLSFEGKKKDLIKFIINSYKNDPEIKSQMEELIGSKFKFGNISLVNEELDDDNVLEDLNDEDENNDE